MAAAASSYVLGDISVTSLTKLVNVQHANLPALSAT